MDRCTAQSRGHGGGGPREAGPPRSPNGASSFHLVWELPAAARSARLVEVSAVLEIVVPPQVPALDFWALQVDFLAGDRFRGGAHTGLQWNRRYPGYTAVNWGGYASQEDEGGISLAPCPICPASPTIPTRSDTPGSKAGPIVFGSSALLTGKGRGARK